MKIASWGSFLLLVGFASSALAADSQNYDDWIKQANTARAEHKRWKAIEFASAARKLDEKRYEAYVVFAAVTREADLALSKTYLQEAFTRAPESKKSLLRQALSETDAMIAKVGKDYDRLQLTIRFAENAPSPAEHLRRLHEVVKTCQDFTRIAPNHPDVWLALAGAALELGDETVGRAAAQGYWASRDEHATPTQKDSALVAKIKDRGWFPSDAAASTGTNRAPASIAPQK